MTDDFRTMLARRAVTGSRGTFMKSSFAKWDFTDPDRPYTDDEISGLKHQHDQDSDSPGAKIADWMSQTRDVYDNGWTPRRADDQQYATMVDSFMNNRIPDRWKEVYEAPVTVTDDQSLLPGVRYDPRLRSNGGLAHGPGQHYFVLNPDRNVKDAYPHEWYHWADKLTGTNAKNLGLSGTGTTRRGGGGGHSLHHLTDGVGATDEAIDGDALNRAADADVAKLISDNRPVWEAQLGRQLNNQEVASLLWSREYADLLKQLLRQTSDSLGVGIRDLPDDVVIGLQERARHSLKHYGQMLGMAGLGDDYSYLDHRIGFVPDDAADRFTGRIGDLDLYWGAGARDGDGLYRGYMSAGYGPGENSEIGVRLFSPMFRDRYGIKPANPRIAGGTYGVNRAKFPRSYRWMDDHMAAAADAVHDLYGRGGHLTVPF